MSTRLALYFPSADVLFDLDPRQEIVAGISGSCDLDFRDFFQGESLRTISRRHFKIVFIEGEGYILHDLGSLNGTWVNGERILPQRPRLLKDGDVIRVTQNEQFVMEVASEDTGYTEPYVRRDTPTTQLAAAPRRGLLHRSLEGEFILDGTRIPHEYLTTLEYQLLSYLYENSGRVCSYESLIHNVWGYGGYEEIQDNTVAKQVSNLRKKLEGVSPGAGVRHIQTVRGRGVKCVPV
jgi:hypothetical protein